MTIGITTTVSKTREALIKSGEAFYGVLWHYYCLLIDLGGAPGLMRA